MQKGFFTNWQKIDRDARKKLICEFIARKKSGTKSRKQKSSNVVEYAMQTSTYHKKIVIKHPLKILNRRTGKKRFALEFSSSSSSRSSKDSIPEKSPQKPPEKRNPLKFRKKSFSKNQSIDKRRQQKQRVIDFISRARSKAELERKNLELEKKARVLAKEEARKQAIEKAKEQSLIRQEALKARREQLLQIKAQEQEKASIRKQEKQKETEKILKDKQEKKQQLLQEKNKLKKTQGVYRKQQKQRVIDFISRARSKAELERKNLELEKKARVLAKEEARKQAIEKAKEQSLIRQEALKARREQLLQIKAQEQEKASIRKQEKQKETEKILKDKQEKKQQLLQFVKNLKHNNQNRVLNRQLEKEAARKQRQLSAIAAAKQREIRAGQLAEFREAERRLSIKRSEALKAELLLAAKQKAERAAFEKKQREEQKQIKEFAGNISNSAGNLGKSVSTLLSSTSASVSGSLKKLRPSKVPSVESFAAGKIVPSAKGKAVSAVEKPKKYKEPVKLGPFLRKNAFRFLFMLFLLMWFGEILYYTMRWKPPREKFEEMFGSVEEGKREGKKISPKPAEMAVLQEQEYKVPSINIEGKRDPFSSGSLTMELMKKPRPTEIAMAYKPEIITIKKTPILVSPSVSKPERETFEKIKPILKPAKPEISTEISEVTTSKVLPPQSVSKPEISPLITPQVECNLVYRGSLIMEGIEYIFIEGKQRTYRVTVGDVVEGFRILKKEKGILTLSRDGVIVEIPAE
ncbi:MAG TPA: hypothetical protein P5025_04635 [Candidatus Ratteibacteria bacterium]|nr:hypothetical protein [Candidatus Ratteibacteria bacterium]